MKVQIKSVVTGGYTLTSVTEKPNGAGTATNVSLASSIYTMTTITSSNSSILYITLNVPDASVSITAGVISYTVVIARA